ncbi:uncharacterized protein LOC126761075 [Bactrocera neohumeralis]|uniref:uncharacterized protein LOC120778243 n=1 Tax=Bactrocera tryoni TaxID=59916 RepID=UPI001A996A56|nr:uncharacterized protein LOC120778243 [Bactrocera tryoni]XP_050332959.1 uncharacterized protein LOC126761075 [Bactrocera neohumeralis]
MAENSLLKITNGKQFERLVHLMQKNPQIARRARIYGQSKLQVEEQWNKIADELNNFGPPRRTGKEWQRVWINYKAKTKKKICDEHFQQYPLTKLEQTVAGLLQAEFGDGFGAVSDELPSASNSFSSAMKEPTKDQYTLLLREIEKKPELGKHTPAFGPPRNQEDWERIAKKLNAIGPPERSIREWKKIFRSLKLNTKKKMEENEEAGCVKHILTETEKAMGKVLELIEAAKPIGETFGVPADKSLPMVTIPKMSPPLATALSDGESVEAEPMSPSTNCTTGARKRKYGDHSSFLFRRQLQHQVQYMKISKEMIEIMDRQSVSLQKLTTAVERQEELMERQLKLLERQTVAIERQAAAMERMAEL